MTFLEVFDKYNLTEKEVHTLKVMKDCNLDKNLFESGFHFIRWHRLIEDGILLKTTYNPLGIFNYKVADFVHE